jgi:hypothetical protein
MPWGILRRAEGRLGDTSPVCRAAERLASAFRWSVRPWMTETGEPDAKARLLPFESSS